jgi:GH15 family glucan-1,4-alpha-glucosidase
VSTHTAGYSKIQDYGVIGDCRAAALISRNGSVDWLCWPRFDSPSIFAALLDPEQGGCWSIHPAGKFEVNRRYAGESNVLETHFQCSSGRAVLLDLMPVASEKFKNQNLLPDHELIRQLVCSDGEMEFEIWFHPRPYYGQREAQIKDGGALGLRLEVGRGAYWLRSGVPLSLHDGGAGARIRIKRGDRVQLSLTYTEEAPAALVPLGEWTQAAVERSLGWWQEWAKQCKYQGPYREDVVRSALVLKLLTYAPSGAVTAAVTTSLPEIVGAGLNWDYRYCWLRDASLSIRAMLGLGYLPEAESFLGWLLHATRMTQPELRVLYTVFGNMAPHERELTHLRGYRDSPPVRVGNGARHQLQLDVYGEVIEAAAQYVTFGGRFDPTTQKVLSGLGKYVAKNWDQPDEGIWEVRSGRENNTYSRLLCWTALDRLVKLCNKGVLRNAPVDLFTAEAEKIRKQILERAWNEKLQSYTSTLDGDSLDANLLRIPWYGLEKGSSERMKSTYRALRQHLGAGKGLLYRYQRNPPEGAFGICGFWAVEFLAVGGGTVQEAHELFQQLLAFGNDLRLFAEEIDPATGDALGNFPQAFTHVGLISAALSIQERERGEPQPAHQTQNQPAATGLEVRA